MKKIFLVLTLAFYGHSVADTTVLFTTLKGKPSSLQQYMKPGKWTVVMIWSNYCHVCNEEAGKYNAFNRKHKNKDAVVVGISIDGAAKIAKQFVKRHKLNYPNLVGTDGEVATLYQSESGQPFIATPSFMLYDPKGKLQAVQAGAVPPKIIEKFMQDPEGFQG